MNIITLSQLQENFNHVIEKSINRKYTIESEINAIINYANTYPPTQKFIKSYKREKENEANRIFQIEIANSSRKLFSNAFNGYTNFGSFDSEIYQSEITDANLYTRNIINQAFEFSEYFKWLNELLTISQKTEKKSSLTHKQKLLALHYLGLDISKFENSKTAKILSEILELSEDNTRQYLSYVSAGKNEVRTKINLEKVNQLFENQGLFDISSQIKKDLEKV